MNKQVSGWECGQCGLLFKISACLLTNNIPIVLNTCSLTCMDAAVFGGYNLAILQLNGPYYSISCLISVHGNNML
jgi:hypothetical protein